MQEVKMMDIVRPIEGIFLDIGWTMNAPASGHWMLIPSFYESVNREMLDSIPKAEWELVFSECLSYLENNHLIQTEQEEFDQFCAFYKIISDRYKNRPRCVQLYRPLCRRVKPC